MISAFIHREQSHMEQPSTMLVGLAAEAIREETASHACTMVATPTKHAKPPQQLVTGITLGIRSPHDSFCAESHTLREPTGSDDRTLRDTISAILIGV